MLQLIIKDADLYNESNETFIPIKGQTILLEHSLVSISKWEAKWQKPFLSLEPKTREESIDYIRFMTITQCVNPLLYTLITDEQIEQVNAYMDDPMTATTIRQLEGEKHIVPNSNKNLTSEEIYYYMVAFGIPFTCEKWHFNRLMTLIRICDRKNRPKDKKSNKITPSARAERSRVNAMRRARLKSSG